MDSTIRGNLKQQSISLNAPTATRTNVHTLTQSFAATTPLEEQVEQAMEDAGIAPQGPTIDERIHQCEQLQLATLSQAEAKAKRIELRKQRALMSYYEQKCKRIKKIKSKSYRKIKRKERDALDAHAEASMMDMEGLEESDRVALREKAEKKLAEERMNLKHKNTTKWQRNV